MMVKLEEEIKNLLTRKRWDHTQGVIAASLQLVSRHQLPLDIMQVKMAALFHDCAKDLPLRMLLKKTGEFGMLLTNSDLLCPQVLHAPVGGGIAKYDFHIRDEAVIHAITNHCTGLPGMALLDKVIFVADYTEQGRNFPGVEELREQAQRDLGLAVLRCMDHTLMYLLKQRVYIHPHMIAARNFFLVEETAPKVLRER